MSDPVEHNNSGREELRGIEADTLDLICAVLTSAEWAEWLKTPLERASAKGQSELAQRLVGAGARIGGALHKAIEGGHVEIARDLLEGGAPFSARHTLGRTPLHVAAKYGETEMVQRLLLWGADTDVFDGQYKTPLYQAAYHGHLDATLALLASGADVSLRCGEFKATAMHAAAEKGHVEIVRAVIEDGADVDATDRDQNTALHVAALFNTPEVIDVFVEAWANIEARGEDGETPLHCAANERSRETLLCLLKHGATVNARDISLKTPLMGAALSAGTQGAAEVVDALLRAGADETIIDREGREAADVVGQHVAERRRLVEDIERVRELLANAPADRTWRRRGYLVLCRAHPDRVQQSQASSGAHHVDTERRTRSRARLARAGGGIAGGSTVDEGTGGDWAAVVSKMLRLREEAVFRTIMGYL